MAAILNSTILDSAILVFPLKLTHTCQDWFPPFAQKKLHSHFPPHHLHKKTNHSFCLNLMMAAILNSTILDSAILVFPLKLTHTCQDWFPPFAQKNFTHTSLPTICTKKTSLIYSVSTWWWQPSWILPCWIQTPCFLLSDSLKNTLTPLWLWLKLIQSDSNSFILTQLDDGSHLEFCHLSFSSQTHSHLPRLVPTICTKKLHSFIMTQLDDGSHLEFHHVGFRHLVIFSQIHSKTLSLHSDSDSN